MKSQVNIRKLETIEELQLVERLEHLVWGGGSIPVHQTITAVRNGGLILGAFSDERLVGFTYSFPGFLNGKVYLCSHNLGIHPDFQSEGIGTLLKEEQRVAASALGYDLLTWTYDPLETRNGYLNLSKLHAVCNEYIENSYGEVQDGLNSGLPTDRFKVEWWIDSSHVADRSRKDFSTLKSFCYEWDQTETGLPFLKETIELTEAEAIFVPVPAHFQQLKKDDLKLAIDWRMKTRHIFQSLFAKGYAAVALKKSEKEPVHHYVFVNRTSIDIPQFE